MLDKIAQHLYTRKCQIKVVQSSYTIKGQINSHKVNIQ